MNPGLLLLRLTVGGFFFGHGMQKLAGWFGGGGLEGTGQFFESLGLRPGKRHALAAGIAEAGGGSLLIVGFATPLAAAGLTATMLTAIRLVHLQKGPWIANGGYEYNAVLIAAAIALAEMGPGAWSVDAARGADRHGKGWALAALGAGALGAVAEAAAAGSAPAPVESDEAAKAQTGDPDAEAAA